jgi:hypothetical protein
MTLETITAADHKALKRCPHCGGLPRVQQIAGEQFPVRIMCDTSECGMSTPKVKLFLFAASIWNRRPKAKRVTKKRMA